MSFAQPDTVRVELSFQRSDRLWNQQGFDVFYDHRSEIEAELEPNLTWDSEKGRISCRIYTDRPGTIDDAPESLDEYRAWVVKNLLDFKRVFGPRLESLVNN